MLFFRKGDLVQLDSMLFLNSPLVFIALEDVACRDKNFHALIDGEIGLTFLLKFDVVRVLSSLDEAI